MDPMKPNLKAARLALGLTQAALASQLGFSARETIAAFECGFRPPSRAYLLALKLALLEAGLTPAAFRL